MKVQAIFTAAALALALASPPANGAEVRSSGALDGTGVLASSGALDATGKDGRPLGGCPLEHTDVQATVSGFVARVVVTQRFASAFSEPVEAIYTFPLSERAAVDAMTMKVGDAVIEGQIQRREDARKTYEAAKAKGQVAGLLDEERPNVFTQSIANLMPGERVEVRIEYVEPLEFESGTFELVVPTVVGPRFSPPGTKDADRVTPPIAAEGTRAGHDIAISVDLDAGVPIRDVSAALHAIDVERPSPTRARVRLRDRAEIPNRDFALRWTVSGDAVQSAFLAHRSGADDGYVSLVLLPPRRVTAEAAAPKEMVFVIDRSGSQMGAPLDKAKETMRYVLDHMNPNDTFQVIDFGSTSNALFPAPQKASAAMKQKAREYIDALEANGGTMMAEAIERVCATPADENRLRIVTFMTDGYVGNDLEVLGLVERLRGTSRWFPFGTGNSVNRFLIDGMARLGGGEPEYVLLSDSGDEAGRKFYERIASPVLTDVTVEWEGLDVVDVFPERHADLWAERPLVIHARYRRAGTGQVVLTGFQQGEPVRRVLPVALPEHEEANGSIASMWARAKVEELLSQDLAAMQSGRFPKPLEEQVVRVALAHRLLTPFTSFVAVEDRVVNRGGESVTVRVPVEMPDGVRYEGIFGAGAEQREASAAGALRARQAYAAAPLAAPEMAKVGAAAPTGASSSVDALALSDEEAEHADRDDASRPAPLPAEVRRRLAKPLRVLLERGPGAPGAAAAVDGWVRVEVELVDGSSAAMRALQAAGLQIESTAEGRIVGLVRLSDLASLASSDGVRRVEPARDERKRPE
jgi:Ca-activated chloride channel homolog